MTCDLKWQEFYLKGSIVLWFTYTRTYIHMYTHIRARAVGYYIVIITLTNKQINYAVITHSFLCNTSLLLTQQFKTRQVYANLY